MTALISSIFRSVRRAFHPPSASSAFTPPECGDWTAHGQRELSPLKWRDLFSEVDAILAEQALQPTAKSTPSLPYWGGGSSGLLRDRLETAWHYDGSSGRLVKTEWLEPT